MTSPCEVTLILGGARSGKSVLAERLIASYGGSPVYVATATAGDGEMAARIQAHQARRGPTWRTVEEPLDLAAVIGREASPQSALLVDCLTLWISNMLFNNIDIDNETARLIGALGERRGSIVLVSNEVGQGIVPDNALARRFRDEAGRLHQRVAAAADRVLFVIAGLAQTLKGQPLKG